MWLYLPIFWVDLLLSVIFRYIPSLNFQYLKLSARIDIGSSLGSNKLKYIPIKLKLKDIKNRKVRYSLFLSGIFKKWNIYHMYNIGVRTFNIQDNNRDVIYITKDIIKENDIVYGERLSDWKVNKNYEGKKSKRFFRSVNLESDEFYKIEPQMYVISAVETFRHTEMKIERDKKYKINCYNDMTKKVKKCIKDDNLFCRSSIKGDYTSYPIFHKVVKGDRIDLAKLMLNSCYDLEEKNKLVTYGVYSDGWETTLKPTYPINLVKSDEMKELIKKWSDIEKIKRTEKILKIKRRIK